MAMQIKGQNINTIDEAFALLSPKQQGHAKRVSAYSEMAFKKAFALNLYMNAPYSYREMQAENATAVSIGALYHDIGKLMLPDGVRQDNEETVPAAEGSEIMVPLHCKLGAEMAEKLIPDFKNLKATEKKMILDGILYHHTEADKAPYAGKVVSIANRLDNESVVLKSEDPVTDAMVIIRSEIKNGNVDPEFYKAFSAVRAKIKTQFNKYRQDTEAVPVAKQIIKRRASRPMELVYQPLLEQESGAELAQPPVGRMIEKFGENDLSYFEGLWLADMRFWDAGKNTMTYEDVRTLLREYKLEDQMGIYFLYELCDSIKRFRTCGLPCTQGFITLPDGFYTEHGIAKKISEVLGDEGISKDEITLIIGQRLSDKPNKKLESSIVELRSSGYSILSYHEYSERFRALGSSRDEDTTVKAYLQGGIDGLEDEFLKPPAEVVKKLAPAFDEEFREFGNNVPGLAGEISPASNQENQKSSSESEG